MTTTTPRRLAALMTLMTGDEKHGASATSTLDALWVLYDQVLNVDPARPDDPDRDRFLLSKGHGPMAYYAVLAARGFLTEDQLRGFGRLDSALGYHPDRTLVPGVEISAGSLGHGLGLAVGTALGLRLTGHPDSRVVVLTGDAELEEGSNAEAIQLAGRLGLNRLMAVVIDNDSAALAWPGGIVRRFVEEGWSGVEVDGRDHAALVRAYAAGQPDRPHVVVARVETEGFLMSEHRSERQRIWASEHRARNERGAERVDDRSGALNCDERSREEQAV